MKGRLCSGAGGGHRGQPLWKWSQISKCGCFQAEPVDSQREQKWNLLGVIGRDGRHAAQTWKSRFAGFPSSRLIGRRRGWIKRRRSGEKSQQRLTAHPLHRRAFVDRLQPQAPRRNVSDDVSAPVGISRRLWARSAWAALTGEPGSGS